MLRRLVITLSAGLLLAGASTAEADQWRRLETAHFVVIGNTPGDDLRVVSRTLERFRDVITQTLPNAAVVSSGETVVVLFKNDASFMPDKPSGAGRANIGGLFRGSDDVIFLALNAENLTWAMQSTLSGYSQFMVANTLGQVPAWVSIGIGEMYRTFQERSGGRVAMLGVPDARQVGTLRGATLIPLAELLNMDVRTPGGQVDPHRVAIFYAESWALVHYMTLGNKARTPQFRNYLRQLRGGGRDAAATALGDLGELERELRSYIAQFAFPAIQLNLAEQPPQEVRRDVENLQDSDSEAYLSGLLASVGNPTTARVRLEKTINAHADSALASLVLGLIELRSNNAVKALPLLEQAGSLSPGDAYIQGTLGRALADEVFRAGGSKAADVERARAVLTRSIELDNQSSAAFAAIGRLYYLYPPADSARAVTFLQRAVALAPAREDYQLSLADALLREKDFPAGTAILGPLLARGSSPGIRDSARRLLSTVNTLKEAAPGGTPTPPATPAGSAPVRIGGPIQAPRKIRDVKPVYPSEAQTARVQGVVIVDATIGPNGSVVDAKILRSIPMLDAAALDAVRQWQFEQTLVDGVPVSVIATVTVNFSLR